MSAVVGNAILHELTCSGAVVEHCYVAASDAERSQLTVSQQLRHLALHMSEVAAVMQNSPDRWVAHHGRELESAAGVALTWAAGIERGAHTRPEGQA